MLSLALSSPAEWASRLLFFFFNDTATTEIYTLSLHDALPISSAAATSGSPAAVARTRSLTSRGTSSARRRSEEHTSELQSQSNLVCRLLLEKKKTVITKRRFSQKRDPVSE